MAAPAFKGLNTLHIVPTNEVSDIRTGNQGEKVVKPARDSPTGALQPGAPAEEAEKPLILLTQNTKLNLKQSFNSTCTWAQT